MNELVPTPPAPARWFKWSILLVWLAVYLSCLAYADWQLDTGMGWMAYGFPGLGVLNLHGAAVPPLVHHGDWHRLVIDVFVNTSLIGIVFTLWVWASLGGMLLLLTGAARSWIVFVAGGVAGAAAHAWQHPTLPFAGSGASGAIMAATGALLLFGFTNKGPVAQAARRRAIGYLIAIVVFTALFALITGGNFIAMGTFEIYALLAGLLAGALCMLIFGPRRVQRPASAPYRAVAFALLALVATSIWIQVPRALAGADAMEQAQDYVNRIHEVEVDAYAVGSLLRRGGGLHVRTMRERTQTQRARLEEGLRALRALPWLEEYAGREALQQYLATFDAYVRLDVPLYSIHRMRMKVAWEAYEPFETKFLLEGGIVRMKEHVWLDEFEK